MPNDVQTRPLVECLRHGQQPCHLLCMHLVRGLDYEEWLPVPLRGEVAEVDSDWICSRCAAEVDRTGSYRALVPQLLPVCLPCCNGLKAEAGFRPDELGVLVHPFERYRCEFKNDKG